MVKTHSQGSLQGLLCMLRGQTPQYRNGMKGKSATVKPWEAIQDETGALNKDRLEQMLYLGKASPANVLLVFSPLWDLGAGGGCQLKKGLLGKWRGKWEKKA